MSGLTRLGILVLAAGSSSRLGEPKQLLTYRHKSLLENTIEAVKKIRDGIVIVILGDNHELIAENIKDPDLLVVYNPDWEKGISSSIRKGISELLKIEKDLQGVILTVCDQPFINGDVLKALIDEAGISGKSIIASAYSGTLGTPVLFCAQHFGDLKALNGTEGAKTLLKKYKAQVSPVPFKNGEIDIDTYEDYSRLIKIK